jgi:hypothetical protein
MSLPVTNSDAADLNEINKDYECNCFGYNIINTSSKIVLTFILSLLVIILSFVYILTTGQVSVFAPIITAVIGLWLPSPAQAVQSKKDAILTTRLQQHNRNMSNLLSTYGVPNIQEQQPLLPSSNNHNQQPLSNQDMNV